MPLLSRLSAIRHSALFLWSTVFVIILSSLTIGAKSYVLPQPVIFVIGILDTAITLFFLFEIALRIYTEPRRRDFFKSNWNIFDFAIVAVSLIPISESEYALLARLLRLFRVMRLVLVIPQLRLLVTSVILSLKRISYIALMMFIIFYIYGAVGNLLFASINDHLWGNIGSAMLTLFRVATFEDWTDVMYETMEVYPLSWLFYISFVFFASFIFLNMMIGVIVNVMHAEHEKDPEVTEPAVAHQQLVEKLDRIEKSVDALQTQLAHYRVDSDSARR